MTLAEQTAEIARVEGLLVEARARKPVLRPMRRADGSITTYESTRGKDFHIQILEFRLAEVRKQKVTE